MTAPDTRSSPWTHGTRWAVSVLAMAGVAVVAGAILYELKVIVVAIVAAMMLTTALDPVAEVLHRRGLRPAFGAAGLLLITIVAVGSLVAWAGSQLWTAGQSLAPLLTQAWSTITQWLRDGPLHISVTDLKSLTSTVGLTSASGASILHGLIGEVHTLAGAVESLVLMLVISTYTLTRRHRYARWLTESFPAPLRPRADRIAVVIYDALGAYVRGIAVNGAINAVLVGAVIWLLGIPMAVPLAALAFIGGFLPVIGTVSAGLVAVLVALAAKGVVPALIMVAVTAVLHHLEVYFVGPLIIGRIARVHPAGQVVALAIGLALAGVIGVFLAGPALTVGVSVVRAIRSEESPATRSG